MALGLGSAFLILSIIPGIPLIILMSLAFVILKILSNFSFRKSVFLIASLYLATFVFSTVEMNNNVEQNGLDLFKIVIVSLPTLVVLLMLLYGINKFLSHFKL